MTAEQPTATTDEHHDTPCPDCSHLPGQHRDECTVRDCGCVRSWDEFPYPVAPDADVRDGQVEGYAAVLYRTMEWSGCAGSDWDRIPEHVRDRWWTYAAALVESPHHHGVLAAVLASAADEIAQSFPLNGELRHDGTTDPQAAAYVEGLHDAWAIVRAAAQGTTP